jgi:hypothetical protein
VYFLHVLSLKLTAFAYKSTILGLKNQPQSCLF